MTAGHASTWLYYKIYLGSSASETESFTLAVLQRISNLAAIERWHFLHYTDTGGAHVRLRLQTAGDVSGLQRAVDSILGEVLAERPALPPSPYRPMILPSAAARHVHALIPGQVPSARVELERYEPDIEAFGHAGVTLAEELFWSSSKTALRILMDERERRYSRKTVAPRLMKSVGDAFVGGADPTVWSAYATYWLDCSPRRGGGWRPRFAAKGRELGAQGVSVLVRDEDLPRPAADIVDAWQRSVAAAAAAFRTVGDEPAPRPVDLAFHFIHLMNNRLGLTPLEEAYLATLIAASSGEASAA